MSEKLNYHRHLDSIAAADVAYVRVKDEQYNASWKRREGAGAFFTIARPWDRFESIASVYEYDIFHKIRIEGLEGPDGSLIACVRDLRRYLLLVEAHMTQELTKPTIAELEAILREDTGEVTINTDGSVATNMPRAGESAEQPGTPLDGGQHARAVSLPEFELDSFAEYMELSSLIQPLYGEVGRHKWHLDEVPGNLAIETLIEARVPDVMSLYVSTTDRSGRVHWLLDRRMFGQIDGVFMPLRVELNDMEHEQTPVWLQGLYRWTVRGEGKWEMRPEYRDGWGQA